MKWTRANVAEYAEKAGLQPVQIDGIPEGFSFKKPEITIGDIVHQGSLIAFIPLSGISTSADSEEDLLTEYNNLSNAN